jgi:hypothetical protein
VAYPAEAPWGFSAGQNWLRRIDWQMPFAAFDPFMAPQAAGAVFPSLDATGCR